MSDYTAKTQILREVLESLMYEYRAVEERRWEEVPELNKKRQDLITKMEQLDWTPSPEDRDHLEFISLKAQVTDLEKNIHQKVETQMDVLNGQMNDLQRRHRQWQTLTVPYNKTYQGLGNSEAYHAYPNQSYNRSKPYGNPITERN